MQDDLKVIKELLWLAVVLSLHNDIRQLMDDDVKWSLRSQRLSEVNLQQEKKCLIVLFYTVCQLF